jgi:hypothetical protein
MIADIQAALREPSPELLALAADFEDTNALAEWIRSKPQRDDQGDPDDGPRVEACQPSQRLRPFADDGNCFERTRDFLIIAELIDPDTERTAATAQTPAGLHTFPIEDGAPVVLDPLVSRNALAASLFRSTQTRNGGGAVTMAPGELVDWIADIAREPAARFERGDERVGNAHRAVRVLLIGTPLCVGSVRDVAFMLALADRESRLWGPTGPRMVATAVNAIDRLDRDAAARWQTRTAPPPTTEGRNAVELALGGYKIRPNTALLASLGRIGGRIGYGVGVEALRLKLASLGLAPPVLAAVESQLQREGLTLGPLAKPPAMLGSLSALTPEAIAGRWLASKV